AVLGLLQGVMEFLPVSSTAHLLIAGRLIGYDDPGGLFTVMIQLGSIFAVMWLYRAKIIAVVSGLPSDPHARHFGLAFIIGGIVMLLVERFRPAPDVVDAERIPAGRALAIGCGQALALIPGV